MKRKPHVIGITGASCSGKGFLCKHLIEKLSPRYSVVLSMDHYYRDLSHIPLSERNIQNFDHPNSIDHNLFIQHLQCLIEGEDVESPIYDFTTHTRSSDFIKIRATEQNIIVEGLFALYWEEVRKLLSVKIFIDLERDICLKRRIVRDIKDRGRTKDSVVKQFQQTVSPMYENFIEPTSQYADLVLRGDAPVEDMVNRVIEVMSVRANMSKNEY